MTLWPMNDSLFSVSFVSELFFSLAIVPLDHCAKRVLTRTVEGVGIKYRGGKSSSLRLPSSVTSLLLLAWATAQSPWVKLLLFIAYSAYAVRLPFTRLDNLFVSVSYNRTSRYLCFFRIPFGLRVKSSRLIQRAFYNRFVSGSKQCRRK